MSTDFFFKYVQTFLAEYKYGIYSKLITQLKNRALYRQQTVVDLLNTNIIEYHKWYLFSLQKYCVIRSY